LTPITKNVILTRYSTDQSALVFSNTASSWSVTLAYCDGIGRVGVTELSLNRGDITGFVDEVPGHGVAGVMGRVTLDACQVAYLVEHCNVFY
jgi:hypothetical protein